ncbi:MAG: helix-turn-helix domain-containing protein [Patescibacteria group bacterium]
MIEASLVKLGLSDKEIKVYLACLRLGPSPVRRIALEAGINRGTAYDILKALIDLGLVSYYHQDKHQYFMAEEPDRLKDALEKKQRQLKDVQSEIEEIIPELKSIYDKAGAKPVVKYYDGRDGIKVILTDVIAAAGRAKEKKYFVFSSSTIKNILYDAYPEFSDERIKAGITVKAVSIGPGGQKQGLDERKWLTEKESAPTYTLIYAGKVAMISVDSNNNPLGVMIEDKNIYQTQKMVFEFIWNKL